MFVPSEDAFIDYYNDLKYEFAFIESVDDSVKIIINRLGEWELFEIKQFKIPIGRLSGKIQLGKGDVVILDFSWYEEYKDECDNFMSAFLWGVFLWNTYKDLPNILGAFGSTFTLANDIIGSLSNKYKGDDE